MGFKNYIKINKNMFTVFLYLVFIVFVSILSNYFFPPYVNSQKATLYCILLHFYLKKNLKIVGIKYKWNKF